MSFLWEANREFGIDMVVLTSKKRLGPKTKAKLKSLFKRKVEQLLSKGSKHVKEIESLLQI